MNRGLIGSNAQSVLSYPVNTHPQYIWVATMLFRHRPLCPRTKSLECPVPWTMRPLDDASLGRYVLWTTHFLVDTSLTKGRVVQETRLFVWEQIGRRHFITSSSIHCKENPFYVFIEKELRGLSQFPHSCVCERFIYS